MKQSSRPNVAPLIKLDRRLDGFEFVEFSAPDPSHLEKVFEGLGFSRIAEHRSKNVSLYRQGHINFIVNREDRSQADFFAE